jgi:hypothetical protein
MTAPGLPVAPRKRVAALSAPPLATVLGAARTVQWAVCGGEDVSDGPPGAATIGPWIDEQLPLMAGGQALLVAVGDVLVLAAGSRHGDVARVRADGRTRERRTARRDGGSRGGHPADRTLRVRGPRPLRLGPSRGRRFRGVARGDGLRVGRRASQQRRRRPAPVRRLSA